MSTSDFLSVNVTNNLDMPYFFCLALIDDFNVNNENDTSYRVAFLVSARLTKGQSHTFTWPLNYSFFIKKLSPLGVGEKIKPDQMQPANFESKNQISLTYQNSNLKMSVPEQGSDSTLLTILPDHTIPSNTYIAGFALNGIPFYVQTLEPDKTIQFGFLDNQKKTGYCIVANNFFQLGEVISFDGSIDVGDGEEDQYSSSVRFNGEATEAHMTLTATGFRQDES